MLATLRSLILCSLLLLAQPVVAEQQAEPVAAAIRPVVGLIIDDLGDRLQDGLRALALPGNVTFAILPQTTFSQQFAELAHSRGKEVMLHQPMQAMNGKKMGPGGLSMHMTKQGFLQALRDNLASVPHVRGINNHMGSLLTRHPGQMAWLMEAIKQRGELFFVDSTTTSQSVALKVATEHQLPTLRRNIFLDHERRDGAIRAQFARFIAQAQALGSSLAIAHPYPETLRVLEELLPTLKEQGIELMPVSELIRESNERREQLWQASLSPSHRGVKNSKQ